MARFPIKFDGWVRGPMLLIGATPSSSYLELTDDTLEIRLGGYRESVPRTNIKAVARRTWSLLYGLGVRLVPQTIGYVASTRDVVQIDLEEPQRFRVLFGLRVRRTGVAVSLEQPEAFIEALEAWRQT